MLTLTRHANVFFSHRAAELLVSLPEEAIEAAKSAQKPKHVEIETPQHMLARCLITNREYQRAVSSSIENMYVHTDSLPNGRYHHCNCKKRLICYFLISCFNFNGFSLFLSTIFTTLFSNGGLGYNARRKKRMLISTSTFFEVCIKLGGLLMQFTLNFNPRGMNVNLSFPLHQHDLLIYKFLHVYPPVPRHSN